MVSKDLKEQGYNKEEEYFHKVEQERLRKYREKTAREAAEQNQAD